MIVWLFENYIKITKIKPRDMGYFLIRQQQKHIFNKFLQSHEA